MIQGATKFQNATVDDIYKNPTSFGAPTFEEFKKNREKYIGRDDESLSQVEKGSSLLTDVQRHIYEIEGYRCKTIEEVEKIASSQGIPLKSLDYRPQLIKLGGGKYDMLIKFVSKHERERRDSYGNK